MIKPMVAAMLLLATAAAAHAAQPDAAAVAANKQAMDQMAAGMSQPSTGDADSDFVAGMLPHHEGAVAMARTELTYGHDPALRRLAHSIIASQSKEITFMRQWQRQHAPH